jgi:hypothetical protein
MELLTSDEKCTVYKIHILHCLSHNGTSVHGAGVNFHYCIPHWDKKFSQQDLGLLNRYSIWEVLVGERVNEGDEGEGIWWVDFIYLYETEQRHLLQLL